MFKLKFRHAVAGLNICVVSLGWCSSAYLAELGRFVCDPSGVQTGLTLKTKLLFAGVRMDPKKWYMHYLEASLHVTVYRNATGKVVFINNAYFPRSCKVLLDLRMCQVA